MKKYLTVDEIDWQDLYDNSYHGHDEFTARIFAAGIKELERLKCTKE